MVILYLNFRQFWTGYFSIASAVFKVNMQTCSLIAIFGVPDPPLPLRSAQKDFIVFTSLGCYYIRNLLNTHLFRYGEIIYVYIFFFKSENYKYTLKVHTEYVSSNKFLWPALIFADFGGFAARRLPELDPAAACRRSYQLLFLAWSLHGAMSVDISLT